MTTPFLGTLGQHPSGLTEASFRNGETCAICHGSEEDGKAGWIPESCTPFSTSAANACTRIYQECARIFPSLRPHAHGTQTRHIFHAACLRPWLENNASCPICRNPIHPEAMLNTAQKLRLEMRRHPKIWGAIGGFCAAAAAEVTAKRLGIDRNVVKWIAYGTGFAIYQGLRRIFAMPNPNRNAARAE